MAAQRIDGPGAGRGSGRDDSQPRRTERLQIMLDDEELAAIDNWRFANRIPSRAAAMRELIRRGMLYDRAAGTGPAGSTGAKSTDFRAIPKEPS